PAAPRPPHAPHSFPTRRSSDLIATSANRSSRTGSIAGILLRGDVFMLFKPLAVLKLRRTLVLPRRRRIVEPDGIAQRQPPRLPRSEEHTSELQSLRHLVCRLLL